MKLLDGLKLAAGVKAARETEEEAGWKELRRIVARAGSPKEGDAERVVELCRILEVPVEHVEWFIEARQAEGTIAAECEQMRKALKPTAPMKAKIEALEAEISRLVAERNALRDAVVEQSHLAANVQGREQDLERLRAWFPQLFGVDGAPADRAVANFGHPLNARLRNSGIKGPMRYGSRADTPEKAALRDRERYADLERRHAGKASEAHRREQELRNDAIEAEHAEGRAKMGPAYNR